jgi:hypothetical protein
MTEAATAPQVLPAGRRIPMLVKLSYTAFVTVLVPFYWANYGPTNFLYFCDLSLFFTLAAVWTESSLLVSMPAVGILLPQVLWMADFLSTAAGHPLLGLTDYMFDTAKPLFLRGLSFFHFWLPILIVYLLRRLGYDRRAFKAWGLVAVAAVLISYFFLPAPPPPAARPNLPVNVNYVFGLSDAKPQTWMDPRLYLLALMSVLSVGIYLPTHAALCRIYRKPTAPIPSGTLAG